MTADLAREDEEAPPPIESDQAYPIWSPHYAFDAAEAMLKQQPGNADAFDHYGRLCSSMGRFDESLALLRRVELARLSPSAGASGGGFHRLHQGGPQADRAGLPGAAGLRARAWIV